MGYVGIKYGDRRLPNRIIKESILTSPSLNALSDRAEKHFYRLLLLVDDYGCFEATAEVIRGKCYPLQLKRSTIKRVEEWHVELETQGILKFWEAEGRRYGVFMNFDKHNSKYCVTNEGKPTRHRRRTPEPPAELLASLCQDLPNPTPNPKHKPNLKTPTKDEARKYYADKLGNLATELEGVMYDFAQARPKTQTLTPKQIIKITDGFLKFNPTILMEARAAWEKNHYAKEGKKENYFLGICRRLAEELDFRRTS